MISSLHFFIFDVKEQILRKLIRSVNSLDEFQATKERMGNVLGVLKVNLLGKLTFITFTILLQLFNVDYLGVH